MTILRILASARARSRQFTTWRCGSSRIKTIGLSFAAVFAMSAFAATGAQAALVVNGGFEEELAGLGWTIEPELLKDGGSNAGVERGPWWTPHSGEYVLDLNAANRGAITQVLSTTAGGQYKLSFWMTGNPECGPLFYKLRVAWGGAFSAEPTFDNRAGLHTPTEMGWEQHTYTVTAAASATPLVFESVEPEGACGPVLDDVSVVPIAVALPTITKMAPTKGPAGGGTKVTITGANLTGATAVKFGSINATSFKVVSVKGVTSITAISPAEVAKAVDVTVTTPNGTSAISSLDHFTLGPPTVTKFSPSSDSQAGGTTVTVTGTGFGLGTEATRFDFGTTEATTVNCTSNTTCTVVAPSHVTGVVDVKATVSGQNSPKVTADQFTYS